MTSIVTAILAVFCALGFVTIAVRNRQRGPDGPDSWKLDKSSRDDPVAQFETLEKMAVRIVDLVPDGLHPDFREKLLGIIAEYEELFKTDQRTGADCLKVLREIEKDLLMHQRSSTICFNRAVHLACQRIDVLSEELESLDRSCQSTVELELDPERLKLEAARKVHRDRNHN